jgi:hypothetical protein
MGSGHEALRVVMEWDCSGAELNHNTEWLAESIVADVRKKLCDGEHVRLPHASPVEAGSEQNLAGGSDQSRAAQPHTQNPPP